MVVKFMVVMIETISHWLTDRQAEQGSTNPQCTGLWQFVITPTNTIILVFRDGANESRWDNMADESVSPTPQFPSTMQITDFQLSEVDFFHVL
jgi:hypothetical protein